MLFLLTKSNKEDQSFSSIIRGLSDGKYLVKIMPINTKKTTKEWQEHYFLLVDECVSSTGNSKYVIHEEFKKHEGIETTKSLSSEDWSKFIENFKLYAFDKMNVTL